MTLSRIPNAIPFLHSMSFFPSPSPVMKVGLLAFLLTFRVSVAHAAGCTVSSSGLNFGNYDVFSSINDDITGTINVNCTSGTGYSIGLSSGSGTFGMRTLQNGASLLIYNLYIDPTRLTIWGDGTGGTSMVNGTGTGANVGLSVYGRIPASQNALVGTYGDLITITVTF
jgi:spore coat protein U-like protein